MKGVGGRLGRALWNRHEGRLRAPWRLCVAGAAVLALGEGLILAAVAVAQFGTGFRPVARALWAVSVTAATLAVATASVLVVAWVVDRRRLADLGLPRSRAFLREAGLGLAIGVGMVGAVVAAALAVGAGTVGGLATSWTGQFALTSYHPLLDAAFWLVVFLGVGALEEVLVRGYVLINVAEGLRGRVGDPRRASLAAVGASATLFAALHAGNPGVSSLAVANALGFGLLLGATVVATGRLAVAIGLHVAWNVALGIGAGLPVSGLETGVALVAVEPTGPALLTGGAFGPEGGLLALVGLAVGAAAVGWTLHRRSGLDVDERLVEPHVRGRQTTAD